MGWTHHWDRDTELDAERFAAAVRDCERVVNASGVATAGFEGTGSPVFAPDHIVFNGKTPQHCEPFEIARVEFDRRGGERTYSFCKTNRMPYDICVQAALIVLKNHLGAAISISSDGTLEDWGAALDIVYDTLHYGRDFNLTRP